MVDIVLDDSQDPLTDYHCRFTQVAQERLLAAAYLLAGDYALNLSFSSQSANSRVWIKIKPTLSRPVVRVHAQFNNGTRRWQSIWAAEVALEGDQIKVSRVVGSPPPTHPRLVV